MVTNTTWSFAFSASLSLVSEEAMVLITTWQMSGQLV